MVGTAGTVIDKSRVVKSDDGINFWCTVSCNDIATNSLYDTRHGALKAYGISIYFYHISRHHFGLSLYTVSVLLSGS